MEASKKAGAAGNDKKNKSLLERDKSGLAVNGDKDKDKDKRSLLDNNDNDNDNKNSGVVKTKETKKMKEEKEGQYKDQKKEKEMKGLMSVVTPTGSYAPYNAQATLHLYPALWSLLLPMTVHGRVSDIWR